MLNGEHPSFTKAAKNINLCKNFNTMLDDLEMEVVRSVALFLFSPLKTVASVYSLLYVAPCLGIKHDVAREGES